MGASRKLWESQGLAWWVILKDMPVLGLFALRPAPLHFPDPSMGWSLPGLVHRRQWWRVRKEEPGGSLCPDLCLWWRHLRQASPSPIPGAWEPHPSLGLSNPGLVAGCWAGSALPHSHCLPSHPFYPSACINPSRGGAPAVIPVYLLGPCCVCS